MKENTENIKDIVSDYTASYAKYVATSRAIPSLVDGFKPVLRRCLLSAYDLKLFHDKRFLKVAKLEGQVMGDYHPHGGASMVGLAQPFTTRYPLFEGQGNFGSPDLPGSVAASRYIETRLTEFAEQFYLESIDYADREDNYDGRLKEVTLFYPPLPGSLFTSAQGIAVGLSTNIPSHDINSVSKSLLSYIDNPESEDFLNDIMPDTCEESIILSTKDEIKKMYKEGSGSISYKAKVHYEIIDGKNALVVDAFPPGYSKSRLQTSYIIEQVENGNLDLINESKDHIRYVFLSKDMDVLKSVEDRLTNSIGYRFYMEHRGVVKKYALKELYDVFLRERSGYVTRKYSDLLIKTKEELSYMDILVLFKKDKNYIKDMFDKTSAEVVKDIVIKYTTTEQIAKRLINTSIRSLLADNTEQILAKINEYKLLVSKYQSYLDNPLSKIVEDIHSITNLMKGDKRNALHVSEITDKKVYNYRGKDLVIDPNEFYYVGTPTNEVFKVSGLELISNNYIIDGNIIVESCNSYYILYDNKGLVGVSSEGMDTGSKFKSDHLIGIIGVDNLEDVSIKGGNGKTQKLSDWVLRKRSAYIQMSNDDQPDIELKVNI